MIPTHQQWIAAQIEERKFHCDPDAHPVSVEGRKQFEDIQRAFFAGVMAVETGFPDNKSRSVTDIGCGPNSILTDPKVRSLYDTCIAVDPIIFNKDQEKMYDDLKIDRVRVLAEEYEGEVTDEVWMYNCLQHTMNPDAVLDTVAKHARRVIRLCEWVDVPTDHLHLHTITAHRIWDRLTKIHGFMAHRTYEGVMGEIGRQTRFYGLVLSRTLPIAK